MTTTAEGGVAGPWTPYREPLSATLRRNIAIAMVLGLVLARFWGGGLARWPMTTLLSLWPSFGGHWVEIFFLNWLRPRLGADRAVQVIARIAVWFVGGIALATGMFATATALANYPREQWPAWWVGGVAFIGVELVAQAAIAFRGLPNFYDGRG